MEGKGSVNDDASDVAAKSQRPDHVRGKAE